MEDRDYGMTIVRGGLLLLAAGYFFVAGYQRAQEIRPLDLGASREMTVARIHQEEDFWHGKVGRLVGAVAGSEEMVEVPLDHRELEAYRRGDVVPIHTSEDLRRAATTRAIKAARPFVWVRGLPFSWHLPVGVLALFFGTLFLVVGIAGARTESPRGSWRTQVVNQVGEILLVMIIAAALVFGAWATVKTGIDRSVELGGVRFEDPLELRILSATTRPGPTLKRRYYLEGRLEPSGAPGSVRVNRREFLEARIGGIQPVVRSAEGSRLLTQREVDSSWPQLRIGETHIVWPIQLSVLAVPVAVLGLFIVVRQIMSFLRLLAWHRRVLLLEAQWWAEHPEE